MEKEPLIALRSPRDLYTPVDPSNSRDNRASSLRADFSTLIGTSRYYYDLQIVALNKGSSREEAYATLEEAAIAKKAKYRALGPYFKPLIISSGGLFARESAKAYKELQALIEPSECYWLDTSIALSLSKARAIAAISIAKDSPIDN